MSNYPPNKPKDLIKCLKRLGFEKKNRVGIGKHIATYTHPVKLPTHGQRPYITIPNHIDDPDFAKEIVKQIKAFGFTENQVKVACGKKILTE